MVGLGLHIMQIEDIDVSKGLLVLEAVEVNFRTGRPEGPCAILAPRLSSLSLAEPDWPTRLAQEPPYGPRCKLRAQPM